MPHVRHSNDCTVACRRAVKGVGVPSRLLHLWLCGPAPGKMPSLAVDEPRPHEPVHDDVGPIVAVELLVVEVVVGCAKHSVAAMREGRRDERKRHPEARSERVAVRHRWPEHHAHHIANNILDRICVHARDGHGCFEAMVEFVDMPVDQRDVKKAMGPVKPRVDDESVARRVQDGHGQIERVLHGCNGRSSAQDSTPL